MNNEWDEYAESWDKDESVKAYANKAYQTLNELINIDNLSVLDFGCGTGALSELISPKVQGIVALDGSSAMIEMLNKKRLPNLTTIADFLTQELIDSHPELAKPFDLIIASSVCSFLPNYEATLGLLKQLLKEGGTFVQWDWLADNDDSAMGLSKNRVATALESHQYKNIQISTPFEMASSKGKMTVLMASAQII